MRNFLHGVLLIIYTFVLIFTAQPAPTRPTPPNNISDLEYTQIQSNRSMALKKPIDPNHPLITFQTKFPAASVILDDATGLPYVISDIQLKPRGGSATQIAHDFLLEMGEVLMPGGSPSELEGIEVLRSRNTEHVHFQQVYQGIPVYRGVVSVHIQNGRVVMYTGRYRPTAAFRDLPLQPGLGESQATEIAMGRLGGIAAVSLRGEVKVDRCIYPVEGEISSAEAANQYRLAYQVKLPAALPLGDWELLIDAHTGEVLRQSNLLMHADIAEGQNTKGAGSVYEENPLTTRVPVNRVFSHLDDSGFLKGDFVDVLIYTGPTGVRVNRRDFNGSLVNNAFSQEQDFRYNPNDPRFDEANVYFHINRIHDYFKETFDFTRLDSPLSVIVRHPAIDERTGRVTNRPMNNAFYSPFTQSLAIGEGVGTANGGLNNLARDADVLYHEYTHAVVDRITRLGLRSHDLGHAMSEAYADYFPCSFFNDPDLGEWSVNHQRGMRNLDNNHRFPDHIASPNTGASEQHYTGLIWGGACWTLREAIGGRATDQIIFNSLFFLPRDGSANFQIGLTALLQADESVFGGAHQETIRQIFDDRGICELGGCPLISGVPTRSAISSVELVGANQYTIEVPNGETTLQVDLRAVQTSPDIDLYVRFDKPVGILQRRFAAPQIAADHKSEGENGIESITIAPQSNPSLQAGTYYMAVINWTDTPRVIDYDLTATIGQISLAENSPSRIEIRLTPTTATVKAGQQQQFTATVEGTDNTTVIWQVNGIPRGNELVGAISSDGVYTAPLTVSRNQPYHH